MALYKIKKLNTWCGDSAAQSYEYFTVGYTRSETLVQRLKLKKLTLIEGQGRPWVEHGMTGKNIYECEEVEVSTIADIGKFNSIPVTY